MTAVPDTPDGFEWLVDEVGNGGAVVLCGAGLSTDSGIPDYRGPTARPRRQITLQEFSRSESFRQRYWARSYVGFEKFEVAHPNAGHRALTALQQQGYVADIITQNVDGLQQEAGGQRTIDLHGRISQVICLDCAQRTPREVLQDRLRTANPGFLDVHDGAIAPDGDAEIEDTAGFVVVPCLNCGGRLKPDVVMFGETVERPKVDACYAAVDAAEMLVVVGSSLQVQSGLRFVRYVAGLHRPIGIVNRGATRGDRYADVKLEAGVSETLTALLEKLG